MKKTKEGIKVLLAEDHVVVRESIRQALENEAKIEVVGEANNGLEAVEMAKRLNPDVILWIYLCRSLMVSKPPRKSSLLSRV